MWNGGFTANQRCVVARDERELQFLFDLEVVSHWREATLAKWPNGRNCPEASSNWKGLVKSVVTNPVKTCPTNGHFWPTGDDNVIKCLENVAAQIMSRAARAPLSAPLIFIQAFGYPGALCGQRVRSRWSHRNWGLPLWTVFFDEESKKFTS